MRVIATSVICVLSFLMISSVLKIAYFTPYAVQERLMKHESASILNKVEYTEDIYGNISESQVDFSADDVGTITSEFPQNKFYKADTFGITMKNYLGRNLSSEERFFYNDFIGQNCEIDEVGLKAFGYDMAL